MKRLTRLEQLRLDKEQQGRSSMPALAVPSRRPRVNAMALPSEAWTSATMKYTLAARSPRSPWPASRLGRAGDHRAQRLSARHQPEHQARPAAVHRRGHARRRRDARRHRPGRGRSWPMPSSAELDKNTLYPAADGQTTLDVEYQGLKTAAHGRREGRRRRPADQLSARRDARLHARRLQHGQLPRRGPRQGRLPPVAVRLRSRTATTTA